MGINFNLLCCQHFHVKFMGKIYNNDNPQKIIKTLENENDTSEFFSPYDAHSLCSALKVLKIAKGENQFGSVVVVVVGLEPFYVTDSVNIRGSKYSIVRCG